MATKTTNLDLTLPDRAEPADIDVLNDNFRILDENWSKGGGGATYTVIEGDGVRDEEHTTGDGIPVFHFIQYGNICHIRYWITLQNISNTYTQYKIASGFPKAVSEQYTMTTSNDNGDASAYLSIYPSGELYYNARRTTAYRVIVGGFTYICEPPDELPTAGIVTNLKSSGLNLEFYKEIKNTLPDVSSSSSGRWYDFSGMSITLEPGDYMIETNFSGRLTSSGLITFRTTANAQVRETVYNDGNLISSGTLIDFEKFTESTTVKLQCYLDANVGMQGYSTNYNIIKVYKIVKNDEYTKLSGVILDNQNGTDGYKITTDIIPTDDAYEYEISFRVTYSNTDYVAVGPNSYVSETANATRIITDNTLSSLYLNFNNRANTVALVTCDYVKKPVIIRWGKDNFRNEYVVNSAPNFATKGTENTNPLLLMSIPNSTKIIEYIYYERIWKNGTLYREYLPMQRNSDGVVGLYETVTKTFYTNELTGTFIPIP